MTFQTLGTGCDSQYIARVYRTIRTWDDWGNTGTCSDILSITRDSLKNIKCADLVEANCRIVCKDLSSAPKNIKISFTDDETKKFDPKNPVSGTFYPSPDLLLYIQKIAEQQLKSMDLMVLWMVGLWFLTSKM